MNSTLVLYAWNAWSPSDSPHVAHAFASRGAAAKIAVAIVIARALSFILFNITFTNPRTYIRYTNPNSSGQTAQTKYQYTAHSSIAWALRALYLPRIANHTTPASQMTPAVTCAPWHPISK